MLWCLPRHYWKIFEHLNSQSLSLKCSVWKASVEEAILCSSFLLFNNTSRKLIAFFCTIRLKMTAWLHHLMEGQRLNMSFLIDLHTTVSNIPHFLKCVISFYQFSQTEKSHLLSRNTTFPICTLQPDKPSQLFKKLPFLQRKEWELRGPSSQDSSNTYKSWHGLSSDTARAKSLQEGKSLLLCQHCAVSKLKMLVSMGTPWGTARRQHLANARAAVQAWDSFQAWPSCPFNKKAPVWQPAQRGGAGVW